MHLTHPRSPIISSGLIGSVVVLSLIWILLFAAICQAEPQTLVWEGEHLASLQRGTENAPEPIRDSLRQLRTAADDALQRAPSSVMDKKLVPPSGDKHDYLSYSRYWWPNPDTEDGLPYVRRDGVVNHKLIANGDRMTIGMLYEDVEALALSAYLLGDERCGEHAVAMLHAWFLSPDTRMNPHLRYAQAVPGRAEGRSPGVIDTRHFLRIIDAALLLRETGHLNDENLLGLQTWFTEFLEWLLSSELGRGEGAAKNNHGAWYDAQTAGLALFVGKPELARDIIHDVAQTRIPQCIEADGSMPEELKRTRSLHYSLFALSALATAARLGEHVEVDLWDRESVSGERLRAALDYAAPYTLDQEAWPHPMIADYAISDRQSQLFYLAASRADDPEYLGYLELAPKRFQGRHLTPLMFRADRLAN